MITVKGLPKILLAAVDVVNCKCRADHWEEDLSRLAMKIQVLREALIVAGLVERD